MVRGTQGTSSSRGRTRANLKSSLLNWRLSVKPMSVHELVLCRAGMVLASDGGRTREC